MLHQLRLLQEQERALRALEDAHLRLAGILVKMLLNLPLLVEDHLTGALIHEPVRQAPGREVARALQQNRQPSTPVSALSEPVWILPSLRMSSGDSRHPCC